MIQNTVSDDVLVEALFDMASDFDVDSDPTVLVLGAVEGYADKVPDEYDKSISGKQIDSFEECPVMLFRPRYAYVDGNDMVLGDGHLGTKEEDSETLPAEFEYVITAEEYVAAVIYQGDKEVERSKVGSSIGNKKL